jgi:hypothetical protein
MTKPVSILIAILALAGALALAQGVFINASGPGSAAGVTVVAQDIRTNLTLSGTGLNPTNVTGHYTEVLGSTPRRWNRDAGVWWIDHVTEIYFEIWGGGEGYPYCPDWVKYGDTNVAGDYVPMWIEEDQPFATGTVHVAVAVVTNVAYSYPSVLGVTSE